MPPIIVNWPGSSGKSYRYEGYPLGTSFRIVPGNYIFAKRNALGQWAPVYIGETADLSSRFDDHHQEGCISQHVATHVFVHQSATFRQARLDEETDLRGKFSPVCNLQ